VLREFGIFEGYKSEEDDVDYNDIISLGFGAVNEAKSANREKRSTYPKEAIYPMAVPADNSAKSLPLWNPGPPVVTSVWVT
jgi:hypothetical protein